MVQIDAHLTDLAALPGAELSYDQITTSATSTATVQGSATTVLTAASIVFGGTTAVLIQVFTPRLSHGVASTVTVRVNIWEDSTDCGTVILQTTGVATHGAAQLGLLRRTPTAGAKVYTARVWLSGAGTATFAAGDGTGANTAPAFIRVVRV